MHGHWLCRKWRCKHQPRCVTVRQCEVKDVCQHVPQCRDKLKCRIKCLLQNEQKCEHKPRCRNELKCRDKQECQNKRRWQFEHECQCSWKLLYTQESFEMYLKEIPRKPTDFFTQNCIKCNNEVLISSFMLYAREKYNVSHIDSFTK